MNRTPIKAMRIIKAGQTLTARSICDHDCIFTAEVLERKGKFVRVKTNEGERRVMVMRDDQGEYVWALGRFSMAPLFRPPENADLKSEIEATIAQIKALQFDIYHDAEHEAFWSLVGVADYFAKAGGPEAEHAAWMVDRMQQALERRAARMASKQEAAA
jgi:hypothetical protein